MTASLPPFFALVHPFDCYFDSLQYASVPGYLFYILRPTDWLSVWISVTSRYQHHVLVPVAYGTLNLPFLLLLSSAIVEQHIHTVA